MLKELFYDFIIWVCGITLGLVLSITLIAGVLFAVHGVVEHFTPPPIECSCNDCDCN